MSSIKLFIFASMLLTAQVFSIQNDDLERAKQLINENKSKEARMLLEEIVNKDDKNHEAFFLLGKVFMKLNDPEEATENFEEAVELYDNSADYHFWLGQAIALDAQSSNVISQAMMASDILEEFEKAVELDPKHIPARKGVIGFYINAPSIMGGDIEKAILNAKELVKLNEMSGRTSLVQIFLKQGIIDSAEVEIKILESKFGSDKSFGGFYNSLGYFYLEKEEFEKAIEAFEKQVKLIPNSANAHDSLGDGYKAAGRFDDAIAQYKKALEINPEFSPSRENLESLEEEMNN